MFDKNAKETMLQNFKTKPEPSVPTGAPSGLDILERLRLARTGKIIMALQLEEEIGNIETQIAWHERHPEAEEIFSLFLERFGLSRP